MLNTLSSDVSPHPAFAVLGIAHSLVQRPNGSNTKLLLRNGGKSIKLLNDTGKSYLNPVKEKGCALIPCIPLITTRGGSALPVWGG